MILFNFIFLFILFYFPSFTFCDRKMIYSFPSFESPITFLTQSPVVDVIAIGLLNGTINIYNIKLDEGIMSLKQEGCVTSITFRTGIY
jgi:U3 small nucleolar RNA-associated protein 21